MTWDLLQLFKCAVTHGKIPASWLWVVDEQLCKLLSTHVYMDLSHYKGNQYTDEMYDRLVQDVYIRLYHRLFDTNIEMFILIMLLALREDDSDKDLYSFICKSYIIRVCTVGNYANQNGVQDILSDTTNAWIFFKLISKRIEEYNVGVSEWNRIANVPLRKCAFLIMNEIYKKNKTQANHTAGAVLDIKLER